MRIAAKNYIFRHFHKTIEMCIRDSRTTAENLARYFGDCLVEQGLPVSQVEMYETPNNCAVYRPQ